MPVFDSTYFSFLRVREMGPEAADWAATDQNWDAASKIMKQLENHSHTGAAALAYPGDTGDPVNPKLPTLTSSDSDGFLQPGDSIAVRLSYVDANGLETQATQETVIDLPGSTPRPLTPTEQAVTPTLNAIPGGSYFYAVTKVKGSGESALSDLLPVSVPFDKTYSVTVGFDPITSYANISLKGNVTNGSAVITNIPSTASLSPGMKVTGSGIPAGALINTVDSGTQVTMSTKATVTGSGITIGFSDGTTAINIYRTAGLDHGFQLITQITNAAATTFEDKNIITPENAEAQPPSVSTFDATRKVTIDWSSYTHPAAAKKLRVYVTQEVGLWGTSNLLTEIDLSGSPDTEVDYLGNEVLQQGFPRNDSQIPASPPKLNLSNEVTGGLANITADSDFNGFLVKNLTLGGNPTVTKKNGMLWHDSGTKQLIARLNGSDVIVGTTTGTYAHPTESSGGHLAANIPFVSGGTSVKTILDRISDSSGDQKQVQTLTRVIGSSTNPTTTSTVGTMVPDMSITFTPDFNNQWMQMVFNGHFQLSNQYSNLSVGIEIDGITIDQSIRTFTAPTTNANVSVSIFYPRQFTFASHTVKVLWWVDTGTAKAVEARRFFSVSEVF